MGRAFQIAAWVGVAAIAMLSLVTPSMRPVTVAPHDLEHLAIFGATGLAVGLGYAARPLRNVTLLVIFSAAIELAQFYAPGRHPRLSDFVVDALAACAGAAVALAITRLATARTTSPR